MSRYPGYCVDLHCFLCFVNLNRIPSLFRKATLVFKSASSLHLAAEASENSILNFRVSFSMSMVMFSPQEAIFWRTVSTFQDGISLYCTGLIVAILSSNLIITGCCPSLCPSNSPKVSDNEDLMTPNDDTLSPSSNTSVRNSIIWVKVGQTGL